MFFCDILGWTSTLLQTSVLISYVQSFLIAEKDRPDEFFDIDDGTKSPNMNLAATKLMLLTCQPPFDKLPPPTRHHDRQYPRFKSLMATAFDGKKIVEPMMNPASFDESSYVDQWTGIVGL